MTENETKMIEVLKRIVLASYSVDGDPRTKKPEIQDALELVQRLAGEKLIYADYRMQWIEIEY